MQKVGNNRLWCQKPLNIGNFTVSKDYLKEYKKFDKNMKKAGKWEDKLKIYDLPKIGMKLFTEITVVQEVFDITLISAQVKVEDKLIAECRMKIFIKKE